MWIPSVAPPLFAGRQPRGSVPIAPILAAGADAHTPLPERDSRPTSTCISDSASASRPAPAGPCGTRFLLPNGGGGGSPAAEATGDALAPGLRQFMEAQSPAIDMASDHAAAAAAGCGGAHDDWWGWEARGGGGGCGGLGEDVVLMAVEATRIPADERDRLARDRIARAVAAAVKLAQEAREAEKVTAAMEVKAVKEVKEDKGAKEVPVAREAVPAGKPLGVGETRLRAELLASAPNPHALWHAPGVARGTSEM
jgi:hypothetical protein